MMQELISMTDRGTFTLPAGVRKTLGLIGGQQFVASTMPTGEIVFRPAITISLEMYTENRIAEFAQEEELGELLKPHSIKNT